MLTREIDTKSIHTANHNIQLNNLQNRIKIIPTVSEAPLLPLNLFQIDELARPVVAFNKLAVALWVEV